MAVKSKVFAGFRRLADPKISLASMSSIFLGACAAAAEGPLNWSWLAVTVLGIFALEVAKNASGEIIDFDSGADLAVAAEDRSPFSGGKRVLVDALLTRRQAALIASASYLAGIAAGLLIVFVREPQILWLGLAGTACAYFYHAPPLRLSYRGLGEIAVALSYGPLILCGTYLVQRGRVSLDAVLISIPLGLLIAAFLWINEFPDYRADRASGKNTLVVRLGPKRASQAFVAILIMAFVWLAQLLAAGASAGAWGGFVALPFAFSAARTLVRHPEDTPAVIPAQVRTLLTFVLFSLGAGIGLLLG